MKTFLRKLLRVLGPMALASSVLMPITASADIPLVTTSQTLAATGNIISPMLTGQTQCSVTITGTWTGTATFQASSDFGASYTAIPATAKGATTSATTTTVNGVFVAPISSDEFFRISWSRSSGSLSAYISCADGTSPPIGAVTIANPGAFPTPAPQPTQPYQVNTTQFGSSNVVTGTGASGAGIPRVTVANDSTIANTSFSASAITAATPAAITTPASSASSVTVLAQNANRNGFTVCNASTQILYLAKAATATTSVYTLPFPAAGTTPTCYTESGTAVYRGPLAGIWASANGNAIVTEW
jgi:hypothetical protein